MNKKINKVTKIKKKINIYNVDCMQHLETLKDNSVDCVITDPPYFIDKLDANWSSKDINDDKINRKFSYIIKIADVYFKDTALIMMDRIIKETKIKNPKIENISYKQYRVFLGPFNNINSLQKSFNDIDILGFENIEIIKND